MTFLLLDKGYFDYDYKAVFKEVTWEDTVRSDEEIRDILSGFGIGTAAKKEMTVEEIQEHIIKEEQRNGS